MKLSCLDSSGWIEITHSGANAQSFLQVLADPASLIVPVITLYEVWKYTTLHADEMRARQIIQFMRQSPVIPVNEDIAIQAADFSRTHKIPMADSLIYTTAKMKNATLWTQDDHFQGLPHVQYFTKVKP